MVLSSLLAFILFMQPAFSSEPTARKFWFRGVVSHTKKGWILRLNSAEVPVGAPAYRLVLLKSDVKKMREGQALEVQSDLPATCKQEKPCLEVTHAAEIEYDPLKTFLNDRAN